VSFPSVEAFEMLLLNTSSAIQREEVREGLLVELPECKGRNLPIYHSQEPTVSQNAKFLYPSTKGLTETKLLKDGKQEVPIQCIKGFTNINFECNIAGVTLFG
jgi:hypothetical protein